MRDPSQVFDLHHSSRQHRIPNPLSEARDRTHSLLVPSQIHFPCATTGTPGGCHYYELPPKDEVHTSTLSNFILIKFPKIVILFPFHRWALSVVCQLKWERQDLAPVLPLLHPGPTEGNLILLLVQFFFFFFSLNESMGCFPLLIQFGPLVPRKGWQRERITIELS